MRQRNARVREQNTETRGTVQRTDNVEMQTEPRIMADGVFRSSFRYYKEQKQ